MEFYNAKTDEVETVNDALYEDWVYEVTNGDTVLGLFDWIDHREEWRIER